MPTRAPCGSWPSPITTDVLVAESVRLGYPSFGPDGSIYWVEGRPSERGRNALVRRRPDGHIEDVVPPPVSVRSRVMEYGGLAYAVMGAHVYFVSDADQRVHVVEPSGVVRVLSLESPWMLAEPTPDPARQRLLLVGERRTDDGEPENAIVALDVRTGELEPLVRGHAFFAAPRPSPDGKHLAYVAWDHPHMPWDAAAVWVVACDDAGRPNGEPRLVAGSPRASAFQPAWCEDGSLVFAYEPEGWWNLHRLANAEAPSASVQPLAESPSEFASPPWQLGTTTWASLGDGELLAAHTRDGTWKLAVIPLPPAHEPHEPAAMPAPPRLVDTPFSHIAQVASDGAGRAVLLAGSPTQPMSVVLLDVASGATEVLRTSSAIEIDEAYVSRPEPLSFPTTDGDVAHAFFYPPRNPKFAPPDGELPPLVVIAHGGPTGATSAAYSPLIQYFTSRGFALCDVNYRGSTGYGRAYRDRLRGKWGVYDVDDCVAAATALAEAKRVDGRRMVIRGSSAGGFTVLAALTFRRVFAAGASLYGVSDLEALVRDTHKFESRYLDAIVGPYPDARPLYLERSPIHFADRLSCPVIFFQGLEDKVVPPNQAERMVEALRAKGIDVAYVPFEGEQHGFRRADSIKRTLEEELAFYGRALGFATAG